MILATWPGAEPLVVEGFGRGALVANDGVVHEKAVVVGGHVIAYKVAVGAYVVVGNDTAAVVAGVVAGG